MINNNNYKAIDFIIRIGLIGFIGIWCFALLRPFITLVLWATILAVAFYPIFEWLKNRLGGRKNLAAILIALSGIAIILGPVGYMATILANNINDLVKSLLAGTLVLPPPPENLHQIPLFGEYINNLWQLASVNIADALIRLEPQIKQLASYLLPITADISIALLQFLLSIIISPFLMINAKSLTRKLSRFLKRISPTKGQEFIRLASTTLRNIIRGVIGIAIIQTLIVGAGFITAGIPGAGLLTFICLILSIIQIGPGLIVFPSIIFIWFWSQMSPLMAVVYTIWMVGATLIDNILKPILMGRGLPLPMIVILLGVFGGTILHGIIGLFIGPVVLALGYELVRVWMNDVKQVSN